MTDITNAQLAAQISELVAYWRTRDLEFQGWLAGSATGGPYSDGRYPLTDYLETTYYVKSPAALQQSVTGMVNSASSYATAAAASQAAAATSKTGADTARDVAVAARDAAVAARDAASTSQSTAATLAANAQTYATSAYNSAATATSAAATATQKAADADADRIAAQAAAAAAQASATSAATFDPNLFYSKTASDSRYRQLSVAVPWADLSGVPSTFTPSAHSHVISDVTNLQTSLDAKAPLASPALSGTPTAPTAAVGTNTTQIATTAFVRGEVSALVAAAPGTLDTLNELASALGNDPNFATTVTNSLAGKAPLTGTGASGTWNISVTGSAGSVAWTNVSGRPTALSSFTNDSGYVLSSSLSSYLPLSGGTLSGGLTGTTASFSGLLSLVGVSTMNTAVPGGAAYNLRFNGSSTNDQVQAITWSYHNLGDSQAGIYVQSSGAYGTKMYLATTDAFVSGAKVAVSIDHSGNVNIVRGALTQAGNQVLHAGNYNSYSPSLTGSGASGTWGISITGSAGSASNSTTVGGLAPAQFFNNMGNNHNTYTDFNNVPGFGAYYVQQGGNSPTGTANHQWYGITLGLGNEYAYSSYASQLYWPRRAQNGETYLYVRDRESGSWNGWTKIRAGYADSAGSADQIDGVAFRNTGSNSPTAADSLASNGITYVASNISLFGQTDGALYSQVYNGDWQHQIFGDYRTGQIALRGKNLGTWQSWRTVLDSSNYTSYSPSLTGSGASGTWGISVTGNAATATSAINASFSTNASVSDTRSTVQGPQTGTLRARFDFVANSTDGLNDGGSFHGVMTFQQWVDASGGGTRQLGFTDNDNLWIRGSGSGLSSYNAWKLLLNSSNYSSYALPLSGGTVSGDVRVTNKLSVGGSTTDLRFGVAGDTHLAGYVYLDLGGALGNFNSWSGRLSSSGGVTRINTNSFVVDRTGYGSGNILEATSSGYVLGGGKFLADAWVHSDRDFPSGTLITTDINYAVTNGDPFILEIRGNTYGNIVPLDIQYQGYIYYDTIINHGGLSNGLNITGLVAINNGGNLCFWFPSQGYWNGYYVRVYVPYATYPRNRVTSIAGVAKPTTAKEVALSANIRQSLHSGNYTSYSPSLTGSGASGTWGISITGNAATVGGRAPGGGAGNLAHYDSSNAYLYVPSWIGLGGGGLFSSASVNGAHFYPNTDATYGTWRMLGSRNGYTGINMSCSNGDMTFMANTNSNISGSHNSSYGWHYYWENGVFFIARNAYGGNMATALHSANYSSYALPLSGGAMTGNISGPAYNSPNFIRFASDNNWSYGCSYDGGSQYWMQVQFYGTGDDTRGFRVLDKNGDAVRFRVNGAGNVTASGNVTAYSDERVKANWRQLDDGFLVNLSSVKSGIYDRTDGEMTQVGVSAQSLRDVLPHAVIESEEGDLSVAYGNAALVAAVELAKEVVALRHEVEQLKQQLH